MNFDDFKAEDFVMDDSFREYCIGINIESSSFWTKWIKENPHKEPDFNKAKELLKIINGNHDPELCLKDQAIFIERLKKEGIVLTNDRPAPIVELETLKPNVRKIWFYRSVAAAIVVALAFGGYFLLNRKNKGGEIAGNDTTPVPVIITPGGNKAVLTIADGSTIVLDNAVNGTVTRQGNTQVLKLSDGQLAYNSSNSGANTVLYNTITTPRGGQFEVTLADGSKVKLNASSSLRFPTTFTGNERKVELTGEAYFEVASNSAMPFKVDVKGVQVEVLGTHFNVSAYDDEAAIKTTLAEGKVKVSGEGKTVSLVPGQLATLDKNNKTLEVGKANVEKELAWVHGLFDFENDHIGDIMRQISRWYDVEVIYETKTDRHYSGGVRRQVNISEVLKMLEDAGGVKFSVNGKKVTVRAN